MNCYTFEVKLHEDMLKIDGKNRDRDQDTDTGDAAEVTDKYLRNIDKVST